MSKFQNPITRRATMKAATILSGTLALQGLETAVSRQANAQPYGQTPKSALSYRDTPNSGHECSNCLQFIPGPSAGAEGHCKVVAGNISPHGWCAAWIAKT